MDTHVIRTSITRALMASSLMFPTVFKQLLDEVFVISKIIKVKVGVISRRRKLRLITLSETLIILDITKTESNNCFIIRDYTLYIFASSLEASNTNKITLRNHAPRSYMT